MKVVTWTTTVPTMYHSSCRCQAMKNLMRDSAWFWWVEYTILACLTRNRRTVPTSKKTIHEVYCNILLNFNNMKYWLYELFLHWYYIQVYKIANISLANMYKISHSCQLVWTCVVYMLHMYTFRVSFLTLFSLKLRQVPVLWFALWWSHWCHVFTWNVTFS